MLHKYLCFFFKFFNLFLAVLGLHCYTWAFSSCGERGLLFVAVRGLLIGWLLLLQSTGSRRKGFSSCSVCALGRVGLVALWHVGSSRTIEPVSPALAGGFLTTAPSGKSHKYLWNKRMNEQINASSTKTSLDDGHIWKIK